MAKTRIASGIQVSRNSAGAALGVTNGSGIINTAQTTKCHIGTRIVCGTPQGVWAPGANADYTWSTMMALPDSFVAIRLVMMNDSTSTIAGVKACASVGGDATKMVNQGGTFTNFTFSGAATVTLAAGTSTSPAITLSDWLPLASTARTDGGSLPLVYVRALTPSTNANSIPLIGLGLAWSGWETKSDGLVFATRFQNADGVGTPANMTEAGATDPSGSPVVGVQYLTTAGSVSIAFFGDSITSGYTATIPGDSWCHKAIAGLGARYSCANLGASGQTTTQCLTRAQVYIPTMRPYMAFFPAFSPNDGTPTAAITNTAAANALQFIDLCRQYGTIPVIINGLPKTTDNTNATSSYTNGQDDFRKTLNSSLSGYGVTVVDFATPLSNSTALGTASKWSAASATVDGTHPSDTGFTSMATIAASTIQGFAI